MREKGKKKEDKGGKQGGEEGEGEECGGQVGAANAEACLSRISVLHYNTVHCKLMLYILLASCWSYVTMRQYRSKYWCSEHNTFIEKLVAVNTSAENTNAANTSLANTSSVNLVQ